MKQSLSCMLSEESFDFSDDIVTRFTLGDCWLLAEKLVEAFEEIDIDARYSLFVDESADDWSHIAVSICDCHVIDVTGVHDNRDFLYLLDYGARKIEAVTNSEFDRIKSELQLEWERSANDASLIAEEISEIITDF